MPIKRNPTERIDESGCSQPPVAKVLDLCLYRVVSERCRGRILPFGVRQMIKDYAWVSFDNDMIREAVKLWCSHRAIALQRNGNINDWDVNQVTDMSSLFRNSSFNQPVGMWD
eukprot:gene30459-biopygen29152